jgi:hypothetical protein
MALVDAELLKYKISCLELGISPAGLSGRFTARSDGEGER